MSDASSQKLVYGIDAKPPIPEAVVLGLQHVLTLWGGTTLVPLVLGPAIFGQGNAGIGVFVNCV